MAYTTTPADNELIANIPGDLRAVTALVDDHTGAATAAHDASAISYNAENVETALNTVTQHAADQNNPHGVTVAQIGAVATSDAVTTATAGKVVKRDANGKVVGDITGNAATASFVPWSGITNVPAAFSPPVATGTVLGGVKIGSGIMVNGDGTITAIPHGKQLFTSSGTFTVPAGITQVWVTMCGGGGGGAGGGNGSGTSGGGSGGWYYMQPITVTSGQLIAVTVGNGGSAGAANSNGGTGGTTSFGSFLSATGGEGGRNTSSNGLYVGGSGGIPNGQNGGSPLGDYMGGMGGSTPLGSGGLPSSPFSSSGIAGTGYGSGGSAGNHVYTGGVGRPGIVIVEW